MIIIVISMAIYVLCVYTYVLYFIKAEVYIIMQVADN